MEAEALDIPMLHGLAVALGVGLLMGIERERHHRDSTDSVLPAGVRSFTLVALAGWVAGLFGIAVVMVALAGTALLVALAYWRTSRQDPGLTTEVALLLCCLIGALAVTRPVLGAGVGVVAAMMLAAKGRLHRMSRELISDAELRDGLLLAAAALVILPLLPDRPLDPLGVFNPAAIWRLVVLIMAIGALGHLALRGLGARWGWAVAGFFSGYVSSTAATLSYARQAQAAASLERPAAGAALAANLASLSLFVPVLAAVSAPALVAVWPILLGAGLGLAAWIAATYAGGARGPGGDEQRTASGRMFSLREALWMAGLLSGVVMLAALVHRWLGAGAALAAAIVAGGVDVHAALASLAQLHASASLADGRLQLGLVGVLALSGTVKAALAWANGPRGYALRLAVGMLAMATGGALGALVLLAR